MRRYIPEAGAGGVARPFTYPVIMDSSGDGYSCSMCYRFTGVNMSQVLRHIGTVHSHQPGFRVVCGIRGCPRTYNNYWSFRKHLRRKHEDTLAPRPLHLLQSEQVHSDDSMGIEPCDQLVPREREKVRAAILFLLKQKELHQTSQVVLNELERDISQLIEQSVDDQASEVVAVLERNGIDYKCVEGLEEVLSNEQARNPFHGLDSAYLQQKAYLSLGLVVSNETLNGRCTLLLEANFIYYKIGLKFMLILFLQCRFMLANI